MHQGTLIETAYGRNNSINEKSRVPIKEKIKYFLDDKLTNLLIWIFSFFVSVFFAWIPFYFQDVHLDITWKILMQEKSLPLIATSTSCFNVFDIIFKKKAGGIAAFLQLFVLMASIVIYFAYFYHDVTHVDNTFSEKAVFFSISLLVLSVLGQIILLYDGE